MTAVGSAVGQQPADSTPSRWKRQPVRAWVSGGLGVSRFFQTSRGAAVRGSGSLSYGPLMVMVRNVDAFEGIDGYESTHETSTLAGYRFGGKHLYVIPALGFGNTTWKDGHGICAAPCTYRIEGQGLAYDLGLHATRMLGGVAVNVSGIRGTSRRERLFAVLLSPQVGWFGK